MKEIKVLIYKELLIEWKQKYAINGLLLYAACMVVVTALALTGKTQISTQTWSVMYWLVMLFVAINAVAKSFMGESEGQMYYLYQMAHPASILVAKMIYNALLLAFTGTISFFLFTIFTQRVIGNYSLFALTLLSGAVAFAANLTMVSAIAAKAENKHVLLSVLSFPIIVPLLLTLIRLTIQSVEGMPTNENYGRLGMIAGITVILSVLSVILFPFVWKD